MAKCKKLDLLKSYLTDKLKAEKSIIKDAERFTFPGSDLIVDVFHTGTVRPQNEHKDVELWKKIQTHIDSLNS
jgi:hypothetical protein